MVAGGMVLRGEEVQRAGSGSTLPSMPQHGSGGSKDRVGESAVVTQDPRFRGGALAQISAFVAASNSIGHTTRLYYGLRPPLRGTSPLDDVAATTTATRFGRVDALGVPINARRLAARLDTARSIWVVATIGFYGLPALRSGRPYACWIGTTLRSEQRGRWPGLDPLRRTSELVNRRPLLHWEREVLRGASLVLAPTWPIAEELASTAGLDPARIGLLPIPIDTQRFAPLTDGDWISRPPRLVFVGRADDPRKNAPLLLTAFARARESMPELTLRLVGRPPGGRLPDGVESVGEVRDVAEHVRDARLLVLPSTQEGFGIVAAEALACGVPVVTTPCGGPAETITRSGAGVVLSGFDPTELAERTLALIQDEATLVSMRQAGRAYVLDSLGVERFHTTLATAMDTLDRAA